MRPGILDLIARRVQIGLRLCWFLGADERQKYIKEWCCGKLVRFGLVAGLAGQAQLATAETFIVPLEHTNGWQFLSYRKIPPNTFRASVAGLEVGITNSAAPAIFPLTNPLHVTELRVSGRVSGALKMPGKQGDKGFDDYTVRVGLVAAGSRRLSWREKMIAAPWVKKLFGLAPRGAGISRIHFYNVGTDPRQVKRTRTHPLSDLMEETILAVADARGDFAFTNRFEPALNVLAVWIACDGDDTKSSFAVTFNKVELESGRVAVEK